jgi:hypothetical protein
MTRRTNLSVAREQSRLGDYRETALFRPAATLPEFERSMRAGNVSVCGVLLTRDV